MANIDTFEEYFCPTRAFQINFSFTDLARNAQAIAVGDVTFDPDHVKSLAFNRVFKLEARIAPAAFEKTFNVSLDEIAQISSIASIEHVLVSLYDSGAVVTRLVCRLKQSIAQFEPESISKLDAAIFRVNEPMARAVFRLCQRLAADQFITHSDVLAFDGAAAPSAGMRRSELATPDENVFARNAEWRAWSDAQIVVTGTSIPVELRDHLKAKASGTFDGGDFDVFRFGLSTVWLRQSAIAFDYEVLGVLLEPSGYLLAKRSIIASASETLRLASDAFAAGKATLSSRSLRRYLALVRGELARCNLFRISTTMLYRDLFAWLEANLPSLAQGVLDLADAEETSRLAIENHDRVHVENVSRIVAVISTTLAAITLVGVVADALGFLDFQNVMFPLSMRLFWVAGALMVAALAFLLSIHLSRQPGD